MEAFRKLADFVCRLSYEDLPATTIHAVKRILLDSVGCMAAGSRTLRISKSPMPRHLAGSHTIVGVGNRFRKEWAVIMNGSHMVATEMDEGNQFAKGHPAAHFLPALLAEAESVACSGRDFITAFVAAYEVASRIGMSISLLPTVHPHGNWGTGSAAVAVAKLRGLGAAEMEEAIILAGSLPETSVWAAALTGANIRNAYIGMGNLTGLMAPDMVLAGIRSNKNVLDAIYSGILGKGFREELLTGNLGREFLIEKNYMKIYACCRFIHGAVEALLALKEQPLREKHPLHPETIRSVKIETYDPAFALNEYEPLNGFAAKFSIPMSVAILLCRGHVSESEFTDENATDPVLRDFAKRVAVMEDKTLTALLPEVRATRVTVEMMDGTTLVKEVRSVTGDPSNPLTDEQIADKFLGLADRVFHESQSAAILEACARLEKLKSITEWTALLG